MKVETKNIEITNVQFIGDVIMLLTLSNDRSFIVPLNKFNSIATLTSEQRKDYEIIDGENLSFLAIDEVFSIHELIGL